MMEADQVGAARVPPGQFVERARHDSRSDIYGLGEWREEVDSTGKVGYQTNDVNANPNGSLQGTWTRQTVTHGDGSN